MKIRSNKTERASQSKVKSFRYERELEKNMLKKEAKQRDLVRKQKMGYFEV